MSAPHQSSEITLRLEAAAEAALRARFPQEAQQGLEAALAAALDPRGLAPDVFPANCFAAGGAILNRHNNSRDDAAFISGRLNDPETRYLVFVHLSPLQGDKQMITFHARSSKLVTSLMDTDSVKSDVVLLGQLTGADAPTTGKSGREMAHTEEEEKRERKRGGRLVSFPLSFFLSLFPCHHSPVSSFGQHFRLKALRHLEGVTLTVARFSLFLLCLFSLFYVVCSAVLSFTYSRCSDILKLQREGMHTALSKVTGLLLLT